MITDRKEYSLTYGDGSIEKKIVVKSEECNLAGEKSEYIKANMLRQIVENPALLGLDFETFKMQYKDGRWVITVLKVIPYKES